MQEAQPLSSVLLRHSGTCLPATPKRGRTRAGTPALRIAIDDTRADSNERSLLYGEYLRDPMGVSSGILAAIWQAGHHALCSCTHNDLPVALRRLPSGLIALARYPHTAGLHADWCPLNGEPTHPSVERSKRLAGIHECSDGFVVTLTDPGSVPAPRDLTRRAGLAAGGGAGSSLLGLEEYLLWKAGLHQHRPGEPRSYATVSDLLAQQAQRGVVRIGGDEWPLGQTLHVVETFKWRERAAIDWRFEQFLEPFRSGIRKGRPFLLCGEFRDLVVSDQGCTLHMAHTNTPLSISRQHLDEAQRRFRVARAALQARLNGARALVLLLARFDGGGIVTLDSAWQLLSPHRVPCDSRHEVRLATLLVQEGRAFDKPMARDLAGGVLPDFLLRDVGEMSWALEVCGIHTPGYDTRFRRKPQRYEALGIHLWVWEAWRDADIPPLPARA